MQVVCNNINKKIQMFNCQLKIKAQYQWKGGRKYSFSYYTYFYFKKKQIVVQSRYSLC